jgi:hypothetical protein
VHSASLQFLPSSHGSSLRTMPVFSSATGLGCENLQRALLQPTEYLHKALDDGLVGTGPVVEELGFIGETVCDPNLVPCGTTTGRCGVP